MTISPINGRGIAEVTTKRKFFGREVLESATFKVSVQIAHAGEEEETEVILPDIGFNAAELRAIRGQVFTFPINPHAGYIDGSVYFAGVHNPVDCDQITFLSEIGSSVSVQLRCVIDFAFEGPVELGKRVETIIVDLSVVKK